MAAAPLDHNLKSDNLWVSRNVSRIHNCHKRKTASHSRSFQDMNFHEANKNRQEYLLSLSDDNSLQSTPMILVERVHILKL